MTVALRLRLLHFVACLFFIALIPFSIVLADSNKQEISDADLRAAEKYLCLKDTLEEGSQLLSSIPNKSQIDDVIHVALQLCGLQTGDFTDLSIAALLAPQFLAAGELFDFDQRPESPDQFIEFHQEWPRFNNRTRGASRRGLTSRMQAMQGADEKAESSCDIEDCDNVAELEREITEIKRQGKALQAEIARMQREYADLKRDYNAAFNLIARKIRDVNRAWNIYKNRPSDTTRDRYVAAVRALANARADALSKRQAVLDKDLAIIEKQTKVQQLIVKLKLKQEILALCKGAK